MMRADTKEERLFLKIFKVKSEGSALEIGLFW
jgi:hypothetical protein